MADPMRSDPDCSLCTGGGGRLLWQGPACRVVLAGDADHPAFCRVIWQEHVREMGDLGPRDQALLFQVVLAVEKTLRELLAPDKMNLASLGNQVPHLHWHVIPRFRDDAHFPDAVWAPRHRPGTPHPVDESVLVGRLEALLGTGS